MPPRRSVDDDAPAGAPVWMITFSDCMTLLLCFFVLLLTFSSFDVVKLRKVSGLFQSANYDTIFPRRQNPLESAVPPDERAHDDTLSGSETPTAQSFTPTRNPRDREEVSGSDAFKDRQVFYLPSDQVFLAGGTGMHKGAGQYLKLFAEFLRLTPGVRVIVEESIAVVPGPAREASLARSWALVRYLTEEAGLDVRRFSLSGDDSGAAAMAGGQPVLVVTFLAERVAQ